MIPRSLWHLILRPFRPFRHLTDEMAEARLARMQAQAKLRAAAELAGEVRDLLGERINNALRRDP